MDSITSRALVSDPETRRALQLDALASILPMERRDRLAALLTDDDVETLKHLAREGMARIVCGRWPRTSPISKLGAKLVRGRIFKVSILGMPPLLFGASREPVLNGIGSQRNREMLSADNIHPRQAPCCQLTTTSSRGAVIWQEFRPSDVAMLEWLAARISADLPSGRGSVRLLCCLLSKGAAGLRHWAPRLVELD